MRWKGGRVVDGTGLENQQVNSLAGSNPVPSAIRNAILAFFYDRSINNSASHKENTNLTFLKFLVDSSQVRYSERGDESRHPIASTKLMIAVIN